TTPDVEAKALETAKTELAEWEAAQEEAAEEDAEDLEAAEEGEPHGDTEHEDQDAEPKDEDEEPAGFWAEVGIDPIKIITAEHEGGNPTVLTGIEEDIADGPDAVDPVQLDRAVELLTVAADWAGDESVRGALAPSESLGWLVSYVVRRDPTRLAPSAPFDTE